MLEIKHNEDDNVTKQNPIKATGLALLLATTCAASMSLAAETQVIKLTQVSCQFLESENDTDHDFSAASADDCKALNKQTAEQRVGKSQTLTLKPGKYTFRVTNKDVPYNLGFWLRGKGIKPLRSSDYGDLMVHVTVETPVKLTETQKNLLREFETSTQADAGKHGPRNKGWLDKAKSFFD